LFICDDDCDVLSDVQIYTLQQHGDDDDDAAAAATETSGTCPAAARGIPSSTNTHPADTHNAQSAADWPA